MANLHLLDICVVASVFAETFTNVYLNKNSVRIQFTCQSVTITIITSLVYQSVTKPPL
jgi:hypothetical protein